MPGRPLLNKYPDEIDSEESAYYEGRCHQKDEDKKIIDKLTVQNRELVRVIKNSIEALKDIKGSTGNREDKNNLIKCVINDLEKVREAN